MNYLPRNRSRNPFVKPALFLLTIFLAGFLFFRLVGGPLIALVSPAWKGESLVAERVSRIGAYFHTKSALIDENNVLRERVSALEVEIASRFYTPEGEEMWEMLGRRRAEGGIPTTVLARPPQTPYDVLVIDAGSDDAVHEGALVSMPEGPVLGMVSETFKTSSKARLFSASGQKTAAILERHGVPVTVEGIGGGNFRIVLARETEVETGDRILSADITSNLMAVVGEIVMRPTDSFKEVRAISPANIFEVHYLIIE